MTLRRNRLAALVVANEQPATLPSGTSVVPPTTGVKPMLTHTEIETEARGLYDHLQSEGIPFDSTSLKTHQTTVNAEYDAILDGLEAKYGFRPNPNRPDDYAKVAQAAGHELPKNPTSGRYKTDEWTIERAAKVVPDLKVLQKARSVRRKLSILTNLGTNMKGGKVYPTYHFDPTLGRTHAGGDANPMNFEEDIQNHVQLPGHTILVVDYSRIEPRVLSTLSKDPTLISDMASDPYRKLAQSTFKVENPTPTQRAQAKVVFLAIPYGKTVKGVAAELGIRPDQAEKIMNAWHARYSVASAYLQDLINKGRTNGYAESYHGRQKPLDKRLPDGTVDPDANDRLAVNSVIQNTAGDLARIGFINVRKNPELATLGVKYITTVHDSMVLAVPTGVDLDKVKSIIRTEMVDKNDSQFGLNIEFKSGPSWGTVA